MQPENRQLSMTKLRKIASIGKLPDEVLEALQEKYPDGWEGETTKISKGNNEFFHAISLDYEDISYLVKVPVEIDSSLYWEKEDELDEVDSAIDKKSMERELEEDLGDDDESDDDFSDD